MDWAERHGHDPLPATAQSVALYLVDRAEVGSSLATVRAAASVIAAGHRAQGFPSPTRSEGVRVTLRGLTRRIGRPQHQAEALTLVVLEAIRSTATLPRRGCGGALEGPAAAKDRGLVDAALCGLISDGGLRRSEVVALT